MPRHNKEEGPSRGRKDSTGARPKFEPSSFSKRGDGPAKPFKKDDSDKPARKPRSGGESGGFRKRTGEDSSEGRAKSFSRGGAKPFRKDSDRGEARGGFRKRDSEGGEESRPRAFKKDGAKPFRKDSDRGGARGSFRKRDSDGGEESRPRAFKKDGAKPFRKDSDRGEARGSFRKRDGDGEKSGGFRKRGDDSFSERRASRGGFSARPTRGGDDKPRRGKEDGDEKPFRRREDKPFNDKREGKTFSERRGTRAGASAGSDRSERPRRSKDEGDFEKKSFAGKRGVSELRREEDRGRGSKKSLSGSRPRKSADTFDESTEAPGGKVRLNKYIANSGVCSRREADELITMGLISVNGKVITELGYKVNPGDEVRHEEKVLRAEKPVYVLLNKPKGYITTTNDPQERKTVMQILGGAIKERIYPIGRLDRNTTGLLLLTNDGELADKLMHPSYNVKKIYKVELDKPLTKGDFKKITEGVKLEEGRAMVDDLAIVSDDGKTIGIEIHIGWNRVVRRIFESLEYEVVKLDRSVYAGLDKKELGRGEWRFLRKEEVVRLKHFK
jgi:23S rRNA pseudouridine2605 synthase